MTGRWSLAAAAAAAAVVISSCNDGEDVREWTAEDHQHTSEPNPGQVVVSRDGGAPRHAAPSEGGAIDEVVWVTWKRTCMKCHGPFGRGDGPEGPMNRTPDLSTSAWQDSATDTQIAASISKGKGKMPAHDLPASTLAGLVRLVRLLRATRPAAAPALHALDAGARDGAAGTSTKRRPVAPSAVGSTAAPARGDKPPPPR